MAKKTKSKAKPKAVRARKPPQRASKTSPARSAPKRSATKAAAPKSSRASSAARDASTGKFLADLAKFAYRAAATSPLAKQVADAALARATEAAQGLAIGMIDTVAGKVRSAAQPHKRSRQNGNGLPEPSRKAWGAAGKALDGVRILDFTHVQSGPTCTQLLGYMGADCIKVERPGVGDITRGQLRDVKGADSLYFTMLNGNKRSITIDSKNPKGKEILERLVKHCDVLVENFAPGALDRMGLSWERVHELNPRMIYASVKGFGPGPYEDCKVYENVAQCAGGSASTTGFRDGPPLVTGAQIGDSGTGLHLAWGIVCALYQRIRTGRGQRVLCAMQDGVLNLTRVKLRDQQRLKHGPLTEYSQYGEGIPFGDAVPRAGNDSGGGQPGWILKCKGWESDPDAYIYFITQAPVWGAICDLIGKPDWKTDPDYATPPARLPRLKAIFATIEEWTMTKTKFEVMEQCNAVDIPVGPILSMKEIAEEKSLRDTGTVVEVDHPTRGKYLTVGNPVKMSDSITEVQRSPLLGEHTEEILSKELGYTAEEVVEIKSSGAVTPPEKKTPAAAA
jgi:formyl-CoA transferase